MSSPLEYLECIDLRGFRAGWTRLTPFRAELLDELAECVSNGEPLRRCSKRLWTSYRRLEETAKRVGIVERRGRRWIAYGKLVEITIYIAYTNDRRPSRNRHIEIRIYLGVPLRRTCKELVELPYYNWLLSIMDMLDPDTREYVLMLDEYGEAGYAKQGCRELRRGEAECRLHVWCNGVYKIDYENGEEIKWVDIYDYRGYRWSFGDPLCA